MVQHLISILDNLKGFVEAVEGKEVKIAKSKSYHIVANAMKNVFLLKARLEFFLLIASELEPFLKEYQGNTPLVPFLYDRVKTLMIDLLKRFIKPAVVENLKTGNDILKLDLKKEANLISTKEVVIGFGPRRALTKVQVQLALQFRSDVKIILQKICQKIKERSPLKYSLTKYASALNPSLIWNDPNESARRFESLCDHLISSNRLNTADADKSLQSWKKLVASEVFKTNCQDFARKCICTSDPDTRLDIFYRNELGGYKEYTQVYSVIKIILIMSHGNAEPERGFSVNKQVLKDNLAEKSLVARRIVYQALPKSGTGFLDVEIDKLMISDVRMAWRRYNDYLDAMKLEKSEKQKKADQKKRKNKEIEELLAKKKKVEEEAKVQKMSIDAQVDALRKL